MNKKVEKTSPTTAVAVATASVVSTRALSSSAATTGASAKNATKTVSATAAKDIPSNNPKSHPKTLDISGTISKKSTMITGPPHSGAAITNGTSSPKAVTTSIKSDKRMAPTTGDAISGSNKMIMESPRHIAFNRGSNISGSKVTPSHENQKNVSPTSSLSSSSPSSSSMSTSGIHPAQFASICREVAQVREEHLSIRQSLCEREGELGKTRVALRNIAQERDVLRKKVSELEHILKNSPEMYSHVAAILSSSQNPLLSGTSPKSDFKISPCSSSSSPSSSKHSPEEIIPPAERYASNRHGHYAPLPSNMSPHPATAIFSSPARNIIVQDQNQKLDSTFYSRPSIVPAIVAGGNHMIGTMGSPRKCNGNEGNLNRKGCLAGGGMEGEIQKVGRAGEGGSNVLPCSPRSSSPNITNNINSQESHQAGHNNKNLHQQQQRQHSTPTQQTNYSQMNNVKLTTTTSMATATFTAAISADTNKSIYYGHEQQGARDTPPPVLSQQYLEYHNGNSRNVNGNDIPGMTNSNNNNNHLKSTSAGGGVKGGGHVHHHQQQQHDYHHQNQHHLSQSGITGLDLMLLGPDCSTKVVEHLVHPVAIESSVREIQHTLVLKGVPLNGDRLREVEIEIDRLNSRIDHLRSQNDVLTLNLEDAKSNADRLTVLLGKYESNNVALQLALRYSAQMGDAYEVLVALMETELGQVVTSLHAAGQLHLICAPPAPSSTNGTSAVVAVSRSGATSSGNNNNSNDNSPSEHVPPLSSAKNGNNKNNIPECCWAVFGGEKPTEKKNYDDYNNNEGDFGGTNVAVNEARNKQSDAKDNGGSNGARETDHHSPPDNNNDTSTTITTTSPVDSSGMAMMVPSKKRSDPDKIISPVSPSSSTSSSMKAMNLLEQARRNRLAAEQAARFLLSQFPSASMHAASSGVVISPTGSDNNNGRGGGSSSFPLRPTCQSNSTTSINSVTSNLSGESDGGQESLSLSSPSVAALDEKDAETQKRQKNEEGEQMSTTITGGVTKGMEVAINEENMSSKAAARVGGNNSPASSSTTFRAPISQNGYGPLNGSTSLITSLLPLLRNAVTNTQQQNRGPPPEAIESAIRHLISTLKAERDAVKQTVVELESESLESLTPSPKPSSPYYGHNNNNNNSSSSNATPTAPWSPAEARKLDLETAVLMQELMAMKEERAELRAQLFLVEKEKSSLELRLRSHESQEDAYRARINYLKSEIMDCKTLHSATTVTTMDTYQQDRNRNDIMKSQQQQQQQQQQKNNGNNRNLETIINNNNNNQNANWEREALLKKRMHELAATLEKVTVSSQIREKQNQEMINELNRANGILMQTLDVAKRKYQNRIKKMEDQILYISERHNAQLKLFGEKMPTVVGKYHG